MKSRLAFAFTLASVLATSLPACAAAGFADVLDTPALMSPLATRSPLTAVTKAGNRLIAVGQRGHILVSTDEGRNWSQMPVPVSSDLTAVYFVDERSGWAVGHDGVVLHTDNGGERWELQLNGHTANALLLEGIERRSAAEPGSANVRALHAEAKRHSEQGADKPFLDVWFADRNLGFVVGAYNLIFRTADGGKTWESWFDRAENPRFYNLYAIRPLGGELHIAGEGGLVLKLDAASQSFKALPLPYNGSFFGVVDTGSGGIVFGLRGNAFRSDDGGATWSKVDTGLAATIVGAARTDRGATLLADAGGRVVATEDGGRSFRQVRLKQPTPVAGVEFIGDQRIVLVGLRGIGVAEMPQR